jgi:16S rRNA (guanine527-N7)-methyltransferase
MKASTHDPTARLAPEIVVRLHSLIDEVLRVNQQFNLTAVRDPDDAWTKHILDSLQGLETGLFEGRKSVIDVGAGVGFPGLALAVARPDLRLTSLDSTRKKCDFIRSAGETFGLDLRVLNERAEDVGQNVVWRDRFDVGIARAVGALPEVCELTLPLVRTGGHAVLWRGEKADEEAKAAANAIRKLGGALHTAASRSYRLPGHELTYHLLVVEKIARTPRQFPRRIGLPKQKPLD